MKPEVNLQDKRRIKEDKNMDATNLREKFVEIYGDGGDIREYFAP